MAELFEVFGINWKLLLIQALNFGALLAVLSYFLYTPLLRLVDERRKKIEQGVKDAEAAKAALERSGGEAKVIVGKASREAEDIMSLARARAEERKKELIEEAEVQASAILSDASERAEEAKRQALKQSEKEIAKAAMLAAEKILRERSA